MDFRVAAKAVIIRDGKIFMIKHRPNDVHKPGQWDIPGGRLELGEDPYLGLQRECHEEISSDIEILVPLDVRHFVRQDGQQVTLIMFLCSLKGNAITLSEEHTEQRWIDIQTERAVIPEFFHSTIDLYQRYIRHDQ